MAVVESERNFASKFNCQGVENIALTFICLLTTVACVEY